MTENHTVQKHDVQKHDRPWRLKFHWHLHKHNDKKLDDRRRSSAAAHYTPSKRLDFTKDIPMNIPYPPFINVEGVPNFRDVGGFSCPRPADAHPELGDEYSVRQGYVYRCSEMSQISAKGDETLTKTLNVHTLYDLRGEREAANPHGKPKGVECISTPVFRAQDITVSMAVEQLRWGTAPDNPPNAGFSQGYVDWYRQIAVYGARYAYRIIFEHIRDRWEEPLLYHCSAGKDRTGVLSAIILKLCGVDDATVAWEYSLTVPGMGVWEDAVEQEMVGDSMMPIRSHGGMTREEARTVCGSRAANMAKWLEVVLDGEFGGARKYLIEHCKFTEADVDKIYANLVVPGKGTVEVVEVPGLEEHAQT